MKLLSLKWWGYVFFLIISSLLLTELVLRVYNPFHFRVKGDKILLQANRKYTFANHTIPVLDSMIIHSKNNMGMRGEEPPVDVSKHFTMITVGGSTTECGYISDGRTWSDVLFDSVQHYNTSSWLNNAGLAGHSTYGHTILLEDYLVKLKPKMILFLIGCNDMLLGGMKNNVNDLSNMKGEYHSIFTFFTKNSELCNVVVNLWRARAVADQKINDSYLNLSLHQQDNFVLSPHKVDERLSATKKHIPAYEFRLKHMIELCKQYQITPVFITQPSLYGDAVDDLTKCALGNIKVNDSTSSSLWWKQLELYNTATKSVATSNGIFLIDLANLLPKSSANFYDYVHFTYGGNIAVGNIIFQQLKPYLESQMKNSK